MKKTIFKLLLVLFLLVIYMYFLVWQNLPDELVVFEGETISMKTILGIEINSNEETIETSSNNSEATVNESGKKMLQISLFDKLLTKNVEVDVLPKTTVIPVGNIAGVKLYTSGVLVVGMSEIEGIDNKKYKPYESTGIEEGDRITKIDGTYIASTEELVECVNESKGKDIKITYIHEEESKECSIEPVQTSQDEYKLGLWVRDSAAGVGTVTFYEPSTKTFGALRTWNNRYRHRRVNKYCIRGICNNQNIKYYKRRKWKSGKNTRYNRKSSKYRRNR